jgi:prophage maintenance system killer protein
MSRSIASSAMVDGNKRLAWLATVVFLASTAGPSNSTTT